MKLVTNLVGKARNKSSLICVGIGTVSVVGAIFLAHRAGRKVDDTMDINKEHIDNIKELREAEEIENEDGEKVPYTQKDYRKDLTKAYVGCAWDFAKLYLPPIILGAGGILCFVKGYRIVGKRLASMTAAYEFVNNSYEKYRENVRRTDGEEKDQQYLYGMEKAKNVDIRSVDPKTGELKVTKSPKDKEIDVINDISNIASKYAVLAEDCGFWTSDMDYNIMQLESMERHANDLLHLYKSQWLSELYSAMQVTNCINDEALVNSHEAGWETHTGDCEIRIRLVPVNIKCGMKDGKVKTYDQKLLIDFNCYDNINERIRKELNSRK